MRTKTAIQNAQIMIEAVKVKSPSHPYISFLDDFIEVMSSQDKLLTEQEVNVSQCFKTSLMFKSQANQAEREKVDLEKKILELEKINVSLTEKIERLTEGL